MKKVMAFTLTVLLLVSLLSSCALYGKYTFAHPYIYEDYTSDGVTVLSHSHGVSDTYPKYGATVSECWEDMTNRFEYAVLRVRRASSVSKCITYEVDGEDDYCGYTVTTLNILEVLEGKGNVYLTISDKETASILEPYYVTPEGEACLNYMFFTNSKGSKYDMLGKFTSYQMIISSANEYIVVLTDRNLDNMVSVNFKGGYERPTKEFKGLYYTPYVFECSERGYTEGEVYAEKHETLSPIIGFKPYLFYSMSAFLYEKYHTE